MGEWADYWFGQEGFQLPRQPMPLRRGWRLEFKPADFWVGIFPKKNGPMLDVWICLVPMFPIHIRWFFRQKWPPVDPDDWSVLEDDLDPAYADLDAALMAGEEPPWWD